MARSEKFRRILLPMDFSPHARSAAGVAFRLASQLSATVRLITVLDVSDLRVAIKAGLDRFTTSAQVHDAVEAWVDRQYDSLSIPKDVTWTKVVQRGFAADEICAAIEKWRPQLVVMGSSGLASRLPVGSKTADVLRRSNVPVVVSR